MRVSFKDEIRVLMIRVYTMQAGSVSWAHYLAVAAHIGAIRDHFVGRVSKELDGTVSVNLQCGPSLCNRS